jgi:AhpC/TSA family protein
MTVPFLFWPGPFASVAFGPLKSLACSKKDRTRPTSLCLMEKGKPWLLSVYRGKVVVLLAYPGDETPICTRQMCSVIRTQVAAASLAFSDEVN